MKKRPINKKETDELFIRIKQLVDEARHRVATAFNAELSLLYWQIGVLIRDKVLHSQRAEYGKQIMVELATKLTAEFGSGGSEKQLRHCLRVAETFPDDTIFSELRRELSWTHIKTLIYIDDELKRNFYIEICKLEKWTSRQLQERLNAMLYERTAISKKPEETIKQELAKLRDDRKLSSELVFRDPYLLNFFGLSDTYSERDLESTILAELQRFIIELGSDFAFLSRQDVLKKCLEGKIRVIEEALNGRTTIWDDPFLPGRNGKTMLGPLLISHTPIDLVIIMLGTNDIQPFHKVSAKEAARGCGALINIVQKSGAGPGSTSPHMLLITPPPFGLISEMMMPAFEGSEEESKKFGHYYRLIAKKYDCYYLDSSQFIESSKVDGIHLDEPEQEKLGLEVKKMVITIFKGFE